MATIKLADNHTVLLTIYLFFYLQDSILDEEFHEEEITVSRFLVHVEYSSIGCLSLKSHSNIVERAEVDTPKLQV